VTRGMCHGWMRIVSRFPENCWAGALLRRRRPLSVGQEDRQATHRQRAPEPDIQIEDVAEKGTAELRLRMLARK